MTSQYIMAFSKRINNFESGKNIAQTNTHAGLMINHDLQN